MRHHWVSGLASVAIWASRIASKESSSARKSSEGFWHLRRCWSTNGYTLVARDGRRCTKALKASSLTWLCIFCPASWTLTTNFNSFTPISSLNLPSLSGDLTNCSALQAYMRSGAVELTLPNTCRISLANKCRSDFEGDSKAHLAQLVMRWRAKTDWPSRRQKALKEVKILSTDPLSAFQEKSMPL